MKAQIKVVEIELSEPIPAIDGWIHYQSLRVLVRYMGKPLGLFTLPMRNGNIAADDLVREAIKKLTPNLVRQLVRNKIENPLGSSHFDLTELINSTVQIKDTAQPLITLAVCTRDRTDNLRICLDTITKLEYVNLDLIVIDNAPQTNATNELITKSFPQFRYILEPRPGLNWARNRAVIEAKGDIIAFTDDDVAVDPQWISAITSLFVSNPEVMAVTGLVLPFELETRAQHLFEKYGGFGRGFLRKWYHLDTRNPEKHQIHIGAGAFGTGANMAFRRCLFDKIGGFDPALDVGTVTNGGGDLEMFFRTIQEGLTLVYEPEAIVCHRHRREIPALKAQLTNNGIGYYSFLVRSAKFYTNMRFAILRFGIWWFYWWSLRRFILSFIKPSFPREYIWAELIGSIKGIFRYPKARLRASQIKTTYADAERCLEHEALIPLPRPRSVENNRFYNNANQSNSGPKQLDSRPISKNSHSTAVRMVDLNKALVALNNVRTYANVLLYFCVSGNIIGSTKIQNHYHSISETQIRDVIAQKLYLKFLKSNHVKRNKSIWPDIISHLSEYYAPPERSTPIDSTDGSVSVVIATYDRPGDLKNCLNCLQSQVSHRVIEIIVVDNHPDSGMTPPVVEQFEGILLVNEPRKGLSYARNAGIIASSGDIVISVDDDVTMPVQWLDKMAAPFVNTEVMAVTGNVLPFELETQSQHLFEEYGGLGRGFKQFSVNKNWFKKFKYEAVPTWNLGATANAAFRSVIFKNPKIGLLHEALGAGMPTGCSEDTYLFYKILKAGHTIYYEQNGYVWHKHRRTMSSLVRQIYNYSKGHIAYHLITLFRDHDYRGLFRLFFGLPKSYLWRMKKRLQGKTAYPVWLIGVEVIGNLVGPFALVRANYKVKKLHRMAKTVSKEKKVDLSLTG